MALRPACLFGLLYIDGNDTMTPFPREDYRPLEPYGPAITSAPVDLSDNTNLWGPHPSVLDTIRGASEETLSRYPSAYATELKEAIGERYGLPSESLSTGCGSNDLLDSVFRASTIPPGKMSFLAPTYSMVPTLAHMNGLAPSPVSWQRAEVDPARLLLEEPDLVYICRPNNPTGGSLDRDWVQGLLALGGPRGPLVVVDEAYADYADDTFLQDAPYSQRMVVLRSFSNLFGMASLPVGFAVGPAEVIREVEKSRGPYKVSRLGERGAVSALKDRSGWTDRMLVELLENRQRLAEELRARGLRPLPSQANFLLVPVEPASAVEVNRALKERGVTCKAFPRLPGIGDALRVTVGPWGLMEEFLQALDGLFEPTPTASGGP